MIESKAKYHMKEITNTIDIYASSEKVFDAFIDPRMLRDWWGVERSFIEPEEGGNYALVWGVNKSGLGYITTGTFKIFEPTSVLEVNNFLYFNPAKEILGPCTLRIDIVDNLDSCSLTVTQSGYQEGHDWDWYYQVVNESWPTVLLYLKNYLEKITRKA